MAAPLERNDDAVFLRRRDPGEDGGLFHNVAQRRVAHALDLVAHHDAAGVDPDLRADMPRDQFIVAGQNLDPNAVAPQRRDRLGNSLARRIRERHEPRED